MVDCERENTYDVIEDFGVIEVQHEPTDEFRALPVRLTFGRLCGEHPAPLRLRGSSALWVTERGGRVKPAEINARFVTYRDALRLSKPYV